MTVPAALGYCWPAEWEPHAATWLSWPTSRETWPGKFPLIAPFYQRLVRAIAEFEPVCVLAGGEDVMREARQLVGELPGVTLFDIPTNDAWTRDHGPTFLTREVGEPALVDWRYNAWGGKYPPFDDDDAAPARIAAAISMRRFEADVVLEGGAIDGDGEGTILTTRSCLLNANRNPGVSAARVERYLADYLGAKKVLWLSGGEITGDDTDGHIDQLVRFVRPGMVAAAVEEDAGDANHDPLKQNLRELAELRDAAGRELQVVTLPMPRPIHNAGQRLPAGYCNFYLVNGGIIVPQYGDPADRPAMEILSGLFPGRRAVSVDARDLVAGLGSIHCITQQQAAGAP